MDLTIEGKLSEKVAIRAHIFDTNIPLQENGYSQSITDFDRIFIELYSDAWRVKAGDINLQNDESFFLTFQKQVSGLEVEANINQKQMLWSREQSLEGNLPHTTLLELRAIKALIKFMAPTTKRTLSSLRGVNVFLLMVLPSKKVSIKIIQLTTT